MPVKVCIWNVQNYAMGDGVAANRFWGLNSHIRNLFITDFVKQNQIDVLLLIEVGERAEPHLDDLLTALNARALPANWGWSYCGSAISAVQNPPLNKNQITFRTDGRYEGYAILWRREAWRAGSRFRLLHGLHDIAVETKPAPAISPLNMVTRGRPADNVQEEVFVRGPKRQRFEMRWNFRAVGGFDPNGGVTKYPYDEHNNLMNHWPELELPATGRDGSFGYLHTRRPVYVVLQRRNPMAPPEQSLCPIVAYHAPSNSGRAGDGTLISGLSRELYVTNGVVGGALDPNSLFVNDSVVYGGDFNFPVRENDWPSDFRYFSEDYDQSHSGGANCEEDPPHAARDQRERGTIVRLLEADYKTPITSAELPDYFGDPLDLVFTRPDPTVTGERADMVEQLLADAAHHYGPTLTALEERLQQVVNAISPLNRSREKYDRVLGPTRKVWDEEKKDWVWRSMFYKGGAFVDFPAFREDLRREQMSSARRAAELYRLFISDHLPLIASIA